MSVPVHKQFAVSVEAQTTVTIVAYESLSALIPKCRVLYADVIGHCLLSPERLVTLEALDGCPVQVLIGHVFLDLFLERTLELAVTVVADEETDFV